MAPSRCPTCAAAVPAGAPWCTLCWTSLAPAQPAPAPASAPVALVTAPAAVAPAVAERPTGVAQAAPADFDPLRDPLPVAALTAAAPSPVPPTAATWPCSGCAAPVPLSESACPTCLTPFLAEVRAPAPALRLPVVGDVNTLSRGGRMAVTAVAGLVVTLLLSLFTAVAGHLL